MKEAKTHDIKWPIILMAVLSASLLAAGVLRHYWDIYVHRTVRGISFFFVGIDAAGDLFSIISVCEFLFLTCLESVGWDGALADVVQCSGRRLMSWVW